MGDEPLDFSRREGQPRRPKPRDQEIRMRSDRDPWPSPSEGFAMISDRRHESRRRH
jgi:hypothetical protein